MVQKLPVLVDQISRDLALAVLVDDESYQSVGATPDRATRILKQRLDRLQSKSGDLGFSEWTSAELSSKKFEIQPAVFRKGRRYPTGPRFALSVRYIELVNSRDQVFLMLPELGQFVYVSERKMLGTVLADTVRSQTATLSPNQIHRLRSPDKFGEHTSSEIRWIRIKDAAHHFRYEHRYDDRLLRSVADPLTDRRYQIMPGSRELEMHALRDSLSHQSCLLVGESGVGKSILVSTLAREFEVNRRKGLDSDLDGETPRAPAFWQSSAGRLIAGMRYLGQWQQRLESVVAELANISGTLALENLLDLVSVGGASPRDSLAAFLLPFIRSGSLRMVAEATPTELDACQRLLPELVDAFRVIHVPPMQRDEETKLLKWAFSKHQSDESSEFDPALPELLSRLCGQFQRHGASPGPAMRIAQELTARNRNPTTNHIAAERHPELPISNSAPASKEARRDESADGTKSIGWLLGQFSQRTGLPLSLIDDTQTISRAAVEETLSRQVIGQPRACHEMAGIVTRIKAGVNDPHRPFGCLLLCGPTGVGKTQLAKALASYLFGSRSRQVPLTRLDMSEYSGATAGYRFLNDSRGNSAIWIQQIRSKPLSVLLFDEIEKASPEILEILLSVLDEGRLTDRLGRVTSFQNSVILMTSNIGARHNASLGFGSANDVDYVAEVKKAFRPEFYNRLDGVVPFASLTKEVVRQITEKELRELQLREGLRRFQRRLKWTPQLVSIWPPSVSRLDWGLVRYSKRSNKLSSPPCPLGACSTYLVP